MSPKELKNSEELTQNLPAEPEQIENAPEVAVGQAEESKDEEVAEEFIPETEPAVSVENPSQDATETESTPEDEVEQPAEETVQAEEQPEPVIAASVSEEPAEEPVEEPVLEEKAEPAETEAPVVETEQPAEEPVAESGQPTEEAVAEPVKAEEPAAETELIAGETDETEIPESDDFSDEILDESEVALLEENGDIPDYSAFTQFELVNALRALLDDENNLDIRVQVEAIKTYFYKFLKQGIEEQKIKFLEAGGAEENFIPEEDPYEQDIKELLKKYRNQRIEFNKKQESAKEENLKLKYQVIEEIKQLINNEESINKTFHDFRELQNRWREIGLVPQAKMKDLWDTYHFHVENFYDYIKINKELRDLDLRKNLEIKMRLCEKAEELLVEPSILKAFNTLQKYHEQWREIGPVPRDKKDEIWERFKATTAKINKKHQDFFEGRKSEQKKNLDAKNALCEKAEEIASMSFKTHKEWDDKSRDLIELQKIWRTIGFAPKRDNNKIYERFRIACDKFFDERREFYSKNKELQQNNLQMKIDLCIQAEALKDSTDWRKTTQDFVNIQRKWKEIGPIPRKQSDIIWKRFRAACDYFFEKKSTHFSSIDDEQDTNLKLKKQLIEEVKEFRAEGDIEKGLKNLREFQRRWTEIGHVPIKEKDIIQTLFREALNVHFDELNLDDSKRNMLRFRNKVSNFSESSRGQNKMRLERDKYAIKLKQLENDLVLLDNNIGFFTQSKNAESLIADVNEKIRQTKEKIEFLKNKIRIIDEYDSEDE